MFSHGKIKTRPVQIGQIHLHKSTVSPWSRIARGFSGVLRTTAQCVSLPFCLWKSKECSGNLGLWQTASPHRGQPAPGDKKTLQNQGCEWQFKNNFKTILDIKVTWRPTTLIQRWKKKESKKWKMPRPVLYTERGKREQDPWPPRPALITPGAVSNGNHSWKGTKALSGSW